MIPNPSLRVLLVEDNELDARAMMKSLTKSSETEFAITRANDLATATELLNDEPFDCILLDLSLPDSAGLVSVEVLTTSFPDHPIVVLTGLDDPTTAVEAVRQGAQDYLAKQTAGPEIVARSVRYAVARHHSEVALRSATEQLGLMQDRDRIARDLHDTVIQQLFATGLGLQSVAGSIADPDLRERVARAVEGIDVSIRQLREAIFGLNAIPDQVALAESIEAISEERSETLGFQPIVEVGTLPEDLSQDVRHEILQVLGEALSNVAKHANATAATIAVVVNPDTELAPDDGQDWLSITVTDNGQGVGSRSGEASSTSLSGRGLENMRKRADDLSGHFHIGPGPGGGTRIEWRIPVS